VIVTELFVYPVKSARGVPCSSVRITPTGFEWDRQWMVINAHGVFLSQRSHPRMALLVPQVSPDGLQLGFPGVAPLVLPFTYEGASVPVRVHDDRCVGIDQGDEAARWISDVLGAPLRMVRVPEAPRRVASPKFAGDTVAPLGFSDAFPVLVCNQASLDDLNTRMEAPIPMDRFRPNIVIEGLEPWSEDHIESVTMGDLTLRLVKPCTRCTVPSVDQLTGERSTDPAPVLKNFRFDKTLRGVTFGENAVISHGLGVELRRGVPCQVTFD
jgi:uncharacterized protein